MIKTQTSKHIKALQELFGRRAVCDFCEEKDCIIMRIIVHPTLNMEGEEMIITGAIMAKKCASCCKESSE